MEKPDPEMPERLEAIAAMSPHSDIARVCRGAALCLQKHFDEAIAEIDQPVMMNAAAWNALFWKGLAYTFMGRDTEACATVEKALEAELPPILISPLRWIEQDKPDSFQNYVAPLLRRYKLMR